VKRPPAICEADEMGAAAQASGQKSLMRQPASRRGNRKCKQTAFRVQICDLGVLQAENAEESVSGVVGTLLEVGADDRTWDSAGEVLKLQLHEGVMFAHLSWEMIAWWGVARCCSSSWVYFSHTLQPIDVRQQLK
jgi:hypothetical protein